MKMKLLATAAASILVLGAAEARDETVRYTLTPVLEDGALTSLQVELKFLGDTDGETRLQLPDRWAGDVDYWRHVRDVEIEGAQRIREETQPIRVLKHAPDAPITVRYRITDAYGKDPAVGEVNGNPYRPIVRPKWFSVLGNAIFATPENEESRPADFRWGPVPGGWTVAGDLDHAAMGARTLVGDVQESVLVGGEGLRVSTHKAAGADFRMAVIGDAWSFNGGDLGAMVGRIIEAQRTYWKQPGETYFVALTPMVTPNPDWVSIGGTGRDDGFSLYAGTNTELKNLPYLLAHEHMHTFNSRLLGGLPQKDEALGYWFSEGFTEFLTHRTLLRSEVWTLEEFVSRLNEDLDAYANSSARAASNAEILKGFWTSAAVQKMPYYRGHWLAHLWEYRLRQASRGKRDMDDVMMAQLARAAKQGSGPVRLSADALFPLVYRELGGPALDADIARHVVGGEPVLLPADLFGTCARIETVTRPPFHRGWDAEATTAAGNVVTGLKPNSPAYKAGMRNGMQIVKREFGVVGDSTVEYGIRVKNTDGTETVYRFMPVGEGPDMTFQKVVLTPGMDARAKARCAKTMSGG